MPCCDGNEVDDEGKLKYDTSREFDKNFKGPIDDRSCTDILCCIIFLVFVIGLGVVSAAAFIYGDLDMLLKPMDSAGKLCGKDFPDRKYLFFFDLIDCAKLGPLTLAAYGGCPTPQVCRKKCPQKDWVWLTLQAEETLANNVNTDKRKEELICQDDVDLSDATLVLSELISKKRCAAYYVNSTDKFERCLPSLLLEAVDQAGQAVTSGANQLMTADNETVFFGNLTAANKVMAFFLQSARISQLLLDDVINAWELILIGLLIGGIVSFIWCLLMRIVSCVIVYLTLFLFFFCFGGASAYCFYYWHYEESLQNASGKFEFTTDFNEYLKLKETWLAFGIISGSLALIILLIVVCLRSRIALAIAIIGQASKAVAAIMSTLIFPIFPFILQIGMIAYWAAVTVYLAAIGRASKNKNATATFNFTVCKNFDNYLNSQCDLKDMSEYVVDEWTIVMQLFNVFMMFWITCFIIGMGQLVLAGTFSSWYWAWEKPKDVPAFPILSSLWRSLRYHIGSVAFGSLIIAIVKMIRLALTYIQSKLKGKENAAAKFFLCCLQCCFWCLEKCLKFLTKNAYIVISIYGSNFCSAAKDAFFLILRNCVRLVVLDNVTDFVLFIGKLLVTGAVGTLSFFFFNKTVEIPYVTSPNLNYYFVPVIIIVIGTFCIATLFFNVYGFAVDTLFICVMEDLERNDGSVEKPYFMSKDLMKVLGKSNNKLVPDADSREGCLPCCC